jgi:predicted DNA-binding transcriptional regulator AlpA
VGNDRTDAGWPPRPGTESTATPDSPGPTLEQVLARLAERLDAGGGPEPLLVGGKELARLLEVSTATVERMKAAGKLPRPVLLAAGCHRWRLAEVREWVACGCPPRPEWEARRNGPKGTPGSGTGR